MCLERIGKNSNDTPKVPSSFVVKVTMYSLPKIVQMVSFVSAGSLLLTLLLSLFNSSYGYTFQYSFFADVSSNCTGGKFHNDMHEL